MKVNSRCHLNFCSNLIVEHNKMKLTFFIDLEPGVKYHRLSRMLIIPHKLATCSSLSRHDVSFIDPCHLSDDFSCCKSKLIWQFSPRSEGGFQLIPTFQPGDIRKYRKAIKMYTSIQYMIYFHLQTPDRVSKSDSVHIASCTTYNMKIFHIDFDCCLSICI